MGDIGVNATKHLRMGLVVAGGLLVAALGAAGAGWASAQEATETPFATRTLIALPTSTPLTPTATLTPTPQLPPWLPYWAGASWQAVPTSAEQPGCPDWAQADVDVSALDYRWIAACRDCLPGAVINPLDTPEPWRRTPTVGPVAAWSLHSTLDVQMGRQAGDAPYVQQVEVFPAESRDVVGVVFSAYHSGGGACDLRILGDRSGSPVASDHWLAAGQYCFGPDEACSLLAPGSIHSSSLYRLVPMGNQLALSLRLGGYPDDCGTDTWQLNNLKWIGVQYETPTATPTATAVAVESDYALTCPIQWLSEAESTAAYVDTLEYSGDGGLGLAWPYGDHEIAYGVLFRPAFSDPDDLAFPVGNQGACGLSLFANASGAAALVEDRLYCAGSYAACAAATAGEQFQWFELPDNGLDLASAPGCFELGLEVYPASADSWVRLDAQFIVDSPGPECDVVPEPTPEHSPTPTSTPYAQFFVGAPIRFDKTWSGSPYALCKTEYNVPGVLVGAWVTHTNVGSLNVKRMNGSGVSCPGKEVWNDTSDNQHVGSPDQCSAVSYAGRTREQICDSVRSSFLAAIGQAWPGYVSNGVSYAGAFTSNMPMAAGSDARFTFESTYNHGAGYWYVVPIFYGLPPAVEPTPTPVPASPTPRPALTPTPALAGNLCAYVALRQRESIFAGSDPGSWAIEPDYEHQTCYTLVPRVSVGLPDALGGGHIGWPAMKMCVVWIRFPSITLLGIKLSFDLMLVPVFVYILGWIRRF